MFIDKQTLDILKQKKFIGGWEQNSDVYLWYRENGERKIIRLPNIPRYFCFRKDEKQNIPESEWKKYKDRGLYNDGHIDNSPYCKITSTYTYGRSTWNQWLTNLDNHGITPLEADINRLPRLMIDYQLNVASPDEENGPRIAFFDIETDDRRNKISIGEDRVLSIAWKDGKTGEEFFEIVENDTDEAEKEFLLKIYKQLIQYDILVGYNNYGFDDEVLAGRLEYHEIDMEKWNRIATLDIYNLFERQGTFRNYDVRNHKLDTIAKAVVGRGKIEHDEKVYELWQNNREKLRLYNLEDVRLIFEMEKILQSVNLVLSVSAFSGLLHSLNYSPMKTVDMFLLRNAARRRQDNGFDFRYRTNYYRPEHMMKSKFSAFSRNALSADKRRGRKEYLEEEFGIDYNPVQGGFVMEAEPGLYENVHAFDFASLYPSSIIAFNIGHDTLVSENFNGPKNKAPNGVYYRTDMVSGISASVRQLIDKRREVKAGLALETNLIHKTALDVQQRAIKELTNSFYGVTAQYGCRHYSKEIAESITSTGRLFLPHGDEFMTARGHKVVIGDTDSLYVSINDDSNPQELVNEYLISLKQMLKQNYNIYNSDMLKMSYEKKMSRVLIIAKKLYSAWIIMEDGKEITPKLVNKGLSLLKGNYPHWASNICLEILTDLLSGRSDDVNHYLRIINREKDKLANGDIDYKELLISARLGKALDEYVNENALIHVRIARRLQEQGIHIPSYMTISYLVTDGSGTVNNGVAESEINDETQYDAVYYFNNVLIKQVESLLTPAFPEIDWETIKFPRFLKRTNYYQKKVTIKL